MAPSTRGQMPVMCSALSEAQRAHSASQRTRRAHDHEASTFSITGKFLAAATAPAHKVRRLGSRNSPSSTPTARMTCEIARRCAINRVKNATRIFRTKNASIRIVCTKNAIIRAENATRNPSITHTTLSSVSKILPSLKQFTRQTTDNF